MVECHEVGVSPYCLIVTAWRSSNRIHFSNISVKMITTTSKRATKVQGVYSGSQERPESTHRKAALDD
jgi:hypothetical protein